ncbi:MAG: acetoacetate--CoA ligase [Rhodobacterales bacterium]|nr:MAG: acetoacetate--CoA ligase [Rhodobacterales bacterium]
MVKNDIIWTPSQDVLENSALAKLARKWGLDPRDYEAMHRRSIADLGAFWGEMWDVLGVIGERGEVVFQPDPNAWMTGAKFFPDARVNMAENLLRQTGDAVVAIERDEAGHRAEITADALRARVAQAADGLRQAGVGPGDRVGVVLPNRFESLISLLAATSLGAVWTSCSPDFGTQAILDRIGQVRPKVVMAQARFRYGGRDHDISERLSEIAARMEGLEQLVMVGEHSVETAIPTPDFASYGDPAAPLTFTRVGFSDPVYVLYTSGTTGAPKAIVHRTGGVLIGMMKEHQMHCDMRPGDPVLWYANNAWMMYHWLVATMASGAVPILYDGAPIVKKAGELDGTPLWNAVAEEKLSHLGVSPKYLATLADMGYEPARDHDLSALRWLMSSGSPMAPHQYDWIVEKVTPSEGYASISGGTDLMGCFLIGAPTLPVRRGTLTAKPLGMATNVFDERGVPVVGRPGELVCTEPFPSQPATFWGENGDQRYLDTYFSDRPEVWTHGDRAEIHADGSATIHGRSDFTLNPQGVRIGTADIYNICDQFPSIEDAVVFGRPIPGDEEIVLCLQMAAGEALTAELAKEVRAKLRAECSPRHVPAAIYEVTAVPYTINHKRVEGAAKATATGGEVKNKASLSNPEALEEYKALTNPF